MFWAAVKPSMAAAGQTSCFARPGTQSCESAYLPMSVGHGCLLAVCEYRNVADALWRHYPMAYTASP